MISILTVKRAGTLLLGIGTALFSLCVLVTLPSLFFKGDFFDSTFGFYPALFVNSLGSTIMGLLSFHDIELILPTGVIDFFSFIKSKYIYSMTILIAAILLSVGLATAATFLFVTLPGRLKAVFQKSLSFTEAIPDLVFIFVFQYGIIFLYKATGVKLLKLYGFDTDVYFLPIVCLGIVPFFLLTRLLVTIVTEEYTKNYVDFAKAKGLSYSEVFFKHVARNGLYSFAQHFSLVYWYMLSSLVIVEYLFELKGFTYILSFAVQPEVIVISILMIMLPYFLVLALAGFLQFIYFGRVKHGEK